jgi:hypothetical protein
VTGSQIWLNPLVDDWQITYTTNLWKNNNNNKFLDVINIGRSNFFQIGHIKK